MRHGPRTADAGTEPRHTPPCGLTVGGVRVRRGTGGLRVLTGSRGHSGHASLTTTGADSADKTNERGNIRPPADSRPVTRAGARPAGLGGAVGAVASCGRGGVRTGSIVPPLHHRPHCGGAATSPRSLRGRGASVCESAHREGVRPPAPGSPPSAEPGHPAAKLQPVWGPAAAPPPWPRP